MLNDGHCPHEEDYIGQQSQGERQDEEDNIGVGIADPAEQEAVIDCEFSGASAEIDGHRDGHDQARQSVGVESVSGEDFLGWSRSSAPSAQRQVKIGGHDVGPEKRGQPFVVNNDGSRDAQLAVFVDVDEHANHDAQLKRGGRQTQIHDGQSGKIPQLGEEHVGEDGGRHADDWNGH